MSTTDGVPGTAPTREDVQFLIDLASKEALSQHERRTLVRIARQVADGVPVLQQAFCGRCDRSPEQATRCPHGERCGRPDVSGVPERVKEQGNG